MGRIVLILLFVASVLTAEAKKVVKPDSITIFGQVLEGIETVEKIELTKTGRADRPVENVRILKATVIE